MGKIDMELFENVVPRTTKNFMTLIKEKKYKGCPFHRIIPNFMIQGGDFTRSDGSGGYSIYGKHFEDENFDIPHSSAGLLSMANSGANTNGSQFFITLEETPWLNNKHVVFGKVIKGMDIVRKIETYGSLSGKVSETIKIVDCGQIIS
jgi:peptidyl-prolyl isomerase F (cyclophilin D)